MKLQEILTGSNYSLDLFANDSINSLENRITERVDKKGNAYYSVKFTLLYFICFLVCGKGWHGAAFTLG